MTIKSQNKQTQHYIVPFFLPSSIKLANSKKDNTHTHTHKQLKNILSFFASNNTHPFTQKLLNFNF